MLACKLSERTEMCLTACSGHIKQEVFCKSTVLNILQYFLHGLLGLVGDNLGTGEDKLINN